MPRIAICTTAALVALFTACRDGAPTIDAPSTHRADAISLRAAGGGGGGGSTKYLTPTGQLDVLLDANPPARTRYRIDYHNGRVIPGDADVYLIYYGDWSTADANAEQSLLASLVSNIGLSPFANILTLYTNTSGQHPSGVIYYGGSSGDAYSHGAILTTADVADIVNDQLATGALPADPSGLFLVVASADVYAEGLDSKYCAYHDWIEFNGTAARIGFIGSPRRSPAQCAPQAAGPNGSYEADAAASLVTAEIFSALTDPYFDAWFDRLGLEGADKCAWDFGQTYKAANGALANIHLGLNDYLLQRFWVPTKNGGYCSLSAP